MVSNNDFPGKYSKFNHIHVVQEISWRNIPSFLWINIYKHVYPQETSSRLNAYTQSNFFFSSQQISLRKLLVTDRTWGKKSHVKDFDYKWYKAHSSFLKTHSHYFHRSQFTDNLALFVLTLALNCKKNRLLKQILYHTSNNLEIVYRRYLLLLASSRPEKSLAF